MADNQRNNNDNILNQILKSINNLKTELNNKEEIRNKDINEIKKNFNEFKNEINDKIRTIEENINKNLNRKKLSKSQDIIIKI